ncbi:MAG: hypothetical protein DRN16_01525 [Thermoplasmata archaeon]|nr:MAG: hypothetical protein DRN16_01525 [Thermoplasmata archaeon]
MRKIGQGLQFNVYEKGDKVVKTPTSKFQIKLKLFLWTPSYLLKPSMLEKETERIIKEREEVLQEIQKRKIEPSLMANLIFRENEIEQDKLIPLGQYLKDYETAKEKIDEYISFIFNCWKNGFSERTYNLTINNGINSDGEIVLMDFGEITFRKSDVERAIKIKRWRKSWSFKRDMKKEIRDYYDKQMLERLTFSNLNKYWKEAPTHN